MFFFEKCLFHVPSCPFPLLLYNINIQMSSSFEDFKQTLAPEQLQLFESRLASDREQYEKVSSLAREVFSDENSRLPFIPAFYLTRTVEQEEQFLNTAIPAAEAARADEFCLAACDKQGPSCIQECKEFALKAFGLGKNLFAALHKPYRPSNFQEVAEE